MVETKHWTFCTGRAGATLCARGVNQGFRGEGRMLESDPPRLHSTFRRLWSPKAVNEGTGGWGSSPSSGVRSLTSVVCDRACPVGEGSEAPSTGLGLR